MRMYGTIIAAALVGGLVGCDEGGSGSAGPGVNTNNSGATTGGAAAGEGRNTSGSATGVNPHGGGAGSNAGTSGAVNASGGTQP